VIGKEGEGERQLARRAQSKKGREKRPEERERGRGLVVISVILHGRKGRPATSPKGRRKREREKKRKASSSILEGGKKVKS